MKRFLLAVLLAAACLLPCFSQAATTADLRGYQRKKPQYQYVYMGEFPYEKDGTVRPVLWRILDVSDGRALLLTEYVIDTSQVIFNSDPQNIKGKTHNYRWIDTYDQSDLYVYLNTEYIDRLFGVDPIRSALLDEPGGGKLFVMNEEQYETPAYGFGSAPLGVHTERQATGTPYAVKQRGLYQDGKGKVTYWVATLKNGSKDYKMKLVGVDGHISVGALTRVNVGLRLAVRLDLTNVQVTGGDGTKKTPFTLTAAAPAAETPAPTAAPAPEATYAPLPTPAPAAETAPTAAPAADAGENIVPIIPASVQTPLPPAEEPAEAIQDDAEIDEYWRKVMAAVPTPGQQKKQAAQEKTNAKKSQDAAPTPAPRQGSGALISLVGDCSIGDAYSSIKLANSYHSVVEKKGFAWPFSRVIQYLSADDLTVANLEVVITTSNNKKKIMYPLRAKPSHVKILLEGSVEMVNTVNNHALDYQRDGYTDTLKYLDEAGIGRFGSINYNKKDGFDDLAVRDVNGIRFGFAGFCYPGLDSDSGVKNMLKRVTKLKKEGCDVVVVSLHWGRETHMTPEAWQIKTAKQLIDGGADVIYGHHPHVLQPIAFYKGKPILFSTGNFTFGTMSDVDSRTGIFQLLYEKTDGKATLRQLQVIPCQTAKRGDFRPFEVTAEKDRKAVYKALMPAKKYSGCHNPPDSFLTTGIVRFDENGKMLE